jgi:hypothetical protein
MLGFESFSEAVYRETVFWELAVTENASGLGDEIVS